MAKAPWVTAHMCRPNTYSGREGTASGQQAQLRPQKMSRLTHNVARACKKAPKPRRANHVANCNEGTLLQDGTSAPRRRFLQPPKDVQAPAHATRLEGAAIGTTSTALVPRHEPLDSSRDPDVQTGSKPRRAQFETRKELFSFCTKITALSHRLSTEDHAWLD